jgi:hypothetical protein
MIMSVENEIIMAIVMLITCIFLIMWYTVRGNRLCFFFGHKWDRSVYFDEFSSNVLDYRRNCKRCGLRENWVQHKPAPYRNDW